METNQKPDKSTRKVVDDLNLEQWLEQNAEPGDQFTLSLTRDWYWKLYRSNGIVSREYLFEYNKG